MIKLNAGKKTALDLCLRGSAGSFSVKHEENSSSTLDVKYFLTHIGLSTEDDSSETLLKHLAPFREIFDTNDLHFDEILQRDIDDARVSSKLIPYILDKDSASLVKFFPPIVIVAMPVNGNSNAPADYYPKVFKGTENKDLHDLGVNEWDVIRSGGVGSEVFQLDRPISEGVPLDHDGVHFRVNTNKCKLVIVDGQHRAMALLALYRNRKSDWSTNAKRKPYESFYEEWDSDYIKQFELKNIQMPAIICTIPELDENFKRDYTLKQASRSIFLTLNKNAQPVSRSRNQLLDDSDLVSSFLRRALDNIKNTHKKRDSESSLKIYNIELDQNSQQKIKNSIAISSVSHLYYVIEHILLEASGDISGVSDRSGKFSSRKKKYFENALARLSAADFLTDDQTKNINRTAFSQRVETEFTNTFDERYIDKILRVFYHFGAFKAHIDSTFVLSKIMEEKGDIDTSSMIFGGQSGIKVFLDHRENLVTKLKETPKLPKLAAIVDRLNVKKASLDNWEKELFSLRAEKLLAGSAKKDLYKTEQDGNIHGRVVNLINQLFDNIFSTVAFQSAIICTYFNILEGHNGIGNEHNDTSTFDEYLDSLNKFFTIRSFDDFKKLVDLFIGSMEGEHANELTKPITESRLSFRQVVSPSEMKPDSWPRYRYLILEIWNSQSDSELQGYINAELDVCRKQIFESLFSRNKKAFSQIENTPVDNLEFDQVEIIFNSTYEQYSDFLGKYFKKKSKISKNQFV